VQCIIKGNRTPQRDLAKKNVTWRRREGKRVQFRKNRRGPENSSTHALEDSTKAELSGSESAKTEKKFGTAKLGGTVASYAERMLGTGRPFKRKKPSIARRGLGVDTQVRGGKKYGRRGGTALIVPLRREGNQPPRVEREK